MTITSYGNCLVCFVENKIKKEDFNKEAQLKKLVTLNVAINAI